MRQRKARLQQARQWKAVAKLSAQQLMQITVERSGAEHLHQTEKKQLYDQIASASGDATSASQAKIHDQAEEIRQLKYMLSHAQKKLLDAQDTMPGMTELLSKVDATQQQLDAANNELLRLQGQAEKELSSKDSQTDSLKLQLAESLDKCNLRA